MKKYLIQIALMLVACCARGQGTFVYDQQAVNGNPPGGEFNIQPGPTGQSFVPSLSAVGFIELYLSDQAVSGSGATILVNLLAGSITNGTFLGSTAPIFIPNGFFNYTNLFFSTPVAVTPGTTYYFQLVVQSGDSSRVGVLPGFVYANGMAFNQGVAQPGADLYFREGVIVPEPSVMLLGLLACMRFCFRCRRNKQPTEKL